MSNGTYVSGGRRTRMHTEVRSPIEVVLSRIVEYVFGFIIALIALRFIFLLFGANPQASFVQLIYGLSGVFMAPFTAIFNTQRVAGATFEWSALVAILVYWLIAWGIVALIRAVSPRERAETVDTASQDEYDREQARTVDQGDHPRDYDDHDRGPRLP